MGKWLNGLSQTRVAIIRVVVIYFLVSSVWIGLSDHAVQWMTNDPAQIVLISTYKGTAFVIATSILIYFLLRGELIKLESEMEKRRQLSAELEKRVEERTADLAAANQNLRAQIEEREKAEQELIEAQTRLEATNKEMETFSYSVSHDLRAPLRQIAGYAGLLLEEPRDGLSDQARQDLNHIQSGVHRMNDLIDALLALSRVTRGSLDFEPIDLSRVAQEVVAQLSLHEPGRDVSVSIEPGLMARGDARLIHILLTNLLENAWKFTRKSDPAAIQVGSAGKMEDEAVFFVRDTGIGFDMGQAERLFQPFQRFHSASEFPGSGIGLATVQRAIQRHGGKVWAESEPGKGTTFFFTLGSE